MKRNRIIKKIGRKISLIRIDRNLTSRYIANTIKISESTLKSLENGSYESVPSYSTLKKIARVLGIRPKSLTCIVSRETGLRIKALRMGKGQSQRELANNMRISYDKVSRWERGQNVIKHTWISCLAKYFKVRPQYLTCQSDEKQLDKNQQASPMDLFAYSSQNNSKSRVVNPLRFALDDAVDKDIVVTYHGRPLKKSDWNLCCRLIKRVTHP